MAKIAYITSGKVGIHSFTHNEISELIKDHSVILCLTQLNKGPYMPENNWETVVASKKKLIWPILTTVIFYPRAFLKMFKIAKKNNAIPYFFIALYFNKYLSNKNIDSLHCQMGDYKLFIGYFLKQLMKIPLTVTVHAHELYQRDVYDRPEKFQTLFNSCDKVITISEFNKELLINDFKLPESKIEVMRLFPEMNRINKILGKVKILVVANWVKKKGYKTLFEAAKKIKRNDFIITVVGGPIYSSNSLDLEKMINEMGLKNKVLLLGRFGGPQLDVVFSGCDIFCLPSITEHYPDGKPAEREGIPVALMEAMGWGKPVISTKHAGIPELVEEVLIEENSVEELITAINYLLDNPEKWEEMGKRNQQIIEEKYHPRNVKQLSSIFSKLTDN